MGIAGAWEHSLLSTGGRGNRPVKEHALTRCSYKSCRSGHRAQMRSSSSTEVKDRWHAMLNSATFFLPPSAVRDSRVTMGCCRFWFSFEKVIYGNVPSSGGEHGAQCARDGPWGETVCEVGWERKLRRVRKGQECFSKRAAFAFVKLGRFPMLSGPC